MSGPLSVVHVSVCICTYKRPELLRRTLDALSRQSSDGRFSYSIVVADNDSAESARSVVNSCAAASSLQISYCVQPVQNISLARNKALEQAHGSFVAFIDDDEFPAADWLATLLKACEDHGADGVLGPVRPFFDQEPPRWLVRGGFCLRPEHRTGLLLEWKQTRTGNVLFRREILQGIEEPFLAEFGNGGEDQDFFRRMMGKGYRFVWCNEAVVHEVVPPERSTRRYLLKRALLRGQNEKLLLTAGSIAKSLVALPAYAAILPMALMLGQHHFMKYTIRLLDHAGKLLVAIGMKPVTGRYLHG